jgi:hypothetical protein
MTGIGGDVGRRIPRGFNRIQLLHPGVACTRAVSRRVRPSPSVRCSGPRAVPLHRQHRDPPGDLALAALLPALFWAAQGAAFVFPGAGGLQAEFPQLVTRIREVWIDERLASASLLALSAWDMPLHVGSRDSP